MKIVDFKNDKCELKKELDSFSVIAIPTETVFGLAASSKNILAFNKLVEIKKRNPDKPFTLMCYSIKQIRKFAIVNKLAKAIINKFMPGSITILLEPKKNIPHYLYLNSDSIGFRIPNNEDLLGFLKYYKLPLLVPSANKKDEKPATSVTDVISIFDNEINYVVNGECITKKASTIIKIVNNDIILIREGPISLDRIKKEINYENCFRK